MLSNPPPDRCDHCASDAVSWKPMEGPEEEYLLADGRRVIRGGRGFLCQGCGHVVSFSSEGLHHPAWDPAQR